MAEPYGRPAWGAVGAHKTVNNLSWVAKRGFWKKMLFEGKVKIS